MQFFNEPLMHDKMGPIQFLHHEIDSRLGHITSKLMNHISNWNIHMTQDEKDALKKLSEAIDDEGQIIVDPSSLFGKFATIDQIPTKVSQLVNDKGFISEIPNYYVTEEELDFKLNNIPVSKYTDYTYINNEISRIYNEITNEYKSYTDTAITESSISEEHIRQIISDYLEQHGLSVSWENILNKPTWAQGAELPKATRSAFGTVKIGNGIEVEDGVISVTGSSTDTNDVIAICYYSSDTALDGKFTEDISAYNFNTHQVQLPAQGWSLVPDFSKKYVYQLIKVCVKGENNYWESNWSLIYSESTSPSGSFDDNFAIHNGADGNVYLYSKTSVTPNTNWNTFTWLARNYGTLYEGCYNAKSPFYPIYSQFYGNNPRPEPEVLFQPSFCLNLTKGDINTRVGSEAVSSEIEGKYIKCSTIHSSGQYWTSDLDGHTVSGITTTITLQNATRNYSTSNYDVNLTGTVELKFVNGLLVSETWKPGSRVTTTPNNGGSGSGSGGQGGGSSVNNTLDSDFIAMSNTIDSITGRGNVEWEENQINELRGKGTTFNEDDNP